MRVALVLALSLASACGFTQPAATGVGDSASAEAYVDRWLRSLGDKGLDHGYPLLHPALEAPSFREQYLRAAGAFTFPKAGDWTISGETDLEEGPGGVFYQVTVEVVGGSGRFPDEFFELLIMQRHLSGQDDTGITVIVKVGGGGTGIWTPGG